MLVMVKGGRSVVDAFVVEAEREALPFLCVCMQGRPGRWPGINGSSHANTLIPTFGTRVAPCCVPGSYRGPVIGDHMPPNKKMPISKAAKDKLPAAVDNLPGISKVRRCCCCCEGGCSFTSAAVTCLFLLCR